MVETTVVPTQVILLCDWFGLHSEAGLVRPLHDAMGVLLQATGASINHTTNRSFGMFLFLPLLSLFPF
jgi:hypothetical protein